LTTRDDGAFVSPWKVILDVVENGRLRSAGVSNFQPDHLERIISETGVAPVVNQIEAHPYFCNDQAGRAPSQMSQIDELDRASEGRMGSDPDTGDRG